MEYIIFCPDDITRSISVTIDANGNASWMRATGEPIKYLRCWRGSVNVACIARGMIHITGGLYIFSIGGFEGTFLFDADTGGEVYPVAIAVIPFCRGVDPNTVFVTTPDGQLNILRVDNMKNCVMFGREECNKGYVSIHRLDRRGDSEFRFVQCMRDKNGIFTVELWKLWSRTDRLTVPGCVDMCVTGDTRLIALLVGGNGVYRVILYDVDNNGKVKNIQKTIGTYNLGDKPPYRLVYVDGPHVVVCDGNGKVFVRNTKKEIVEHNVSMFVPFVIKPFGNVQSRDGVIVMNVLGGRLLDHETSFRDIVAMKQHNVKHHECFQLVSNSMEFAWWNGGSVAVVFGTRDVHIHWAAYTIHLARFIAFKVGHSVAVFNEHVTESSFTVFATDHVFPIGLNARIVLLFSDDKQIEIPPQYIYRTPSHNFRMLSTNPIPELVIDLTAAIKWINRRLLLSASDW